MAGGSNYGFIHPEYIIKRHNVNSDENVSACPVYPAYNESYVLDEENGWTSYDLIPIANPDAGELLDFPQPRNISVSTTDLEDGVSELTTGAIYLVYEE